MNREKKFRYTYSDEENWIMKIYTLSEIINGDPFEVLNDNPLLKKYKYIDEDEYTGLRDKNNKEIYENDIVREVRYKPDGQIGVVKFGEGDYNPDWYSVTWWGWYIDGIDTEFYGDTDKIVEDFEVIGNIYEHPELLKIR